MTAAFLREAADTARRFGTSPLGEDFNDVRHIAVADWLDSEADLCEKSSWYPDSPESLNVARAYLGRDS